MLAILPHAVFILLALYLLYDLTIKRTTRLITSYQYLPKLGKTLLAAKLGVAGLSVVFDILALAAYASKNGGDIVTASLVTNLLASCMILPILHLEFFRRLRASPLITLYLTISTLCNAARIRTFAIIGLSSSNLFFFTTFGAGFGCRIVLWFLETAPKSAFVEMAEGDKPLAHEETSSFVARLLITSVDPVLWKGFRSNLTIQSLGSIHSQYDSEILFDDGFPFWQKHLATSRKNPLLRTMFSCFGGVLLAPIVPCVIYSLAQATQPTLVSDVIRFIESYRTAKPAPVEHGWGLVAAYGLVFLISTFSWGLFQMNALRCSVAVRGFLVQMVYRKALRVNIDIAKEIGTGQSTSLMSVDIERIVNQTESLHLLYSSFIIVLIGMIILYYTIGAVFVSTIIVAVIFLLSIPWLARNVPSYQKAWSAQTDQRVRLVNSILRNITAVKLSGYENILVKKLIELRRMEQSRQAAYLKRVLVISGLTNWLKGLLSLATLITYTIVSQLSDSHTVDTAVFFTVIAVLGVVTDPLLIVGQRYAAIMAALASLRRIEEFLQQPEKIDYRLENERIEGKDLSFGPTPDTVLLKEMSFSLPVNALTMVVGQVGAGKSTLLHGLLGEANKLAGELYFPTNISIGYCSQDAWLKPGDSIRENIQFTSPFNPALYRSIVKACSLDTDFRIWPQGDRQKAQGLSGGQKQRIALARALYARPDLLILDDVFSALDKQTEEHIFQSLFGSQGLLNDKTTILATNGVHRLPRADYIIALGERTITQQGTYEETCISPGAVQELLAVVGATKSGSNAKAVKRDSPPERADDATSSYIASVHAKLDDIEDEMSAVLSTKSPSRVYFTAGGIFSFVLVLLLCIMFSVVPGIVPVYIQAWTTSVRVNQSHMYAYLGGYIALEMAFAILFVMALFYYFIVYIRDAGRRLHAKAAQSLMRAPISYFQDKPIGRLLSRFSQDLFVIDFELPNAFTNCFCLIVEMRVMSIIITVAAPYVGIVLLCTLIMGIALQRFYVRTSRQVRRMDFIAKSPLYTLFAETIATDGLKTIRAVRAEPDLIRLAIDKGNTSQVPYYIMQAVKKWLNLVMGLVVTIINVMLVLLAVINRSSTSAGLLAVALVQATSLVFTLNLTIVSAAEFETCLVAVSRVQETIETEPEEDEKTQNTFAQIDDDVTKELELKKLKTPYQARPDHWITAGSVRFENVTMRYRPDLPPALADLTFKVAGGKKVGIVGRSGCGKSTCLAALFRMNEIESGGIYIDGVNIKDLPRTMLRNAMTVIPQDPLVLELSVRENLDLEGVCSDQQIWSALERTQCKALIEGLPEKLDTIVTGDGGDFSRGERQLLALARALLRDRKLLVLDEASSSVDVATDAVIQQVLREAFSNCTILAVAHRLNTLLDYDDIIVLSQGRIVEQGPPSVLMTKPHGAFSLLLRGLSQNESEEIIVAESAL